MRKDIEKELGMVELTKRTDLALECRENTGCGEIEGVTVSEREFDGGRLTEINVLSDEGGKKLGKPKGRYITMETDGFPEGDGLFCDATDELTECLLSLVPDSGTVLVAGLGNTDITPDALGPKCSSLIFSTRHIDGETAKALSLPPLRNVCAVSPGVTGQTGIETLEIIAGICDRVKPCCVICVDALAAGSVKRLAKTVQISSSGIEPGSGVNNARRAVTRETLGVPVIGIGVPTVVDAASLVSDIAGDRVKKDGAYDHLVVTPGNIDVVISSASRFLALAVNRALQRGLTPEELLNVM
mgnify:FL=1